MSSFVQGMQLGQKAFNDGQDARRQDELDAERRWRFQQEQDVANRAAGDRADLGYIAQGGLTGITPNMTAPDARGVGPVADPSLVDIRARGMPITGGTGAMAPTPVEGAPAIAAPPAGGLALPAAVGMTEADKSAAIGAIQLRKGDVSGYRTSREDAKALKKEQASTEFGQKLVKMTNEELATEAKKWITDNPAAAGTLGYDPKTRMFTIVHDTGAAQQIDPIQARSYALAAFNMGNGDVEKGMTQMLSADAVRKAQSKSDREEGNKNVEAVGKQALGVGNLAVNEGQLQVSKGQLGVAQAGLALRKQELQRKETGGIQTFVDTKTGEPVLGSFTTDKDGNRTFNKIALPDGIRLPKDMSNVMSKEKVLTIAAKMVSDGAVNPATNKPYTLPAATADINAAMGGEPTGTPVDMEALAKSLKAAKQGGASVNPATSGPAPTRAPDPPPQMTQRGLTMAPNPAYAEWAAKYGEAYAAEHPMPVVEDPTARAARARGFNPYQQNRVGP